MARGWESKSVEQQQDEAKEARSSKGKRLSPEQIAAENRKKGLQMSRQRIVQQLEAASNPQHRKMLESALAELDRQLAQDAGANLTGR